MSNPYLETCPDCGGKAAHQVADRDAELCRRCHGSGRSPTREGQWIVDLIAWEREGRR
jgi:DnaJ-class molecular chaperone